MVPCQGRRCFCGWLPLLSWLPRIPLWFLNVVTRTCWKFPALWAYPTLLYEGISRNSRTEAIPKYTTHNKCVWKLPASTQQRAAWHTDSLDMVVLPSTGASRIHNICMDGDTSPEDVGCTCVCRDVCVWGVRARTCVKILWIL
jgi:hypothetical protein